jgi:hypothetical protein
MEIYIELSNKQLKAIENGRLNFSFPDGVNLTRKNGSRYCYLDAEDDILFDSVVDKLDELGLSWQRTEQSDTS